MTDGQVAGAGAETLRPLYRFRDGIDDPILVVAHRRALPAVLTAMLLAGAGPRRRPAPRRAGHRQPPQHPGSSATGPASAGKLGGPVYDDVYRVVVPAGHILLASMTGDPGTDFDLYLFDSTATDIYADPPVGLVAVVHGPDQHGVDHVPVDRRRHLLPRPERRYERRGDVPPGGPDPVRHRPAAGHAVPGWRGAGHEQPHRVRLGGRDRRPVRRGHDVVQPGRHDLVGTRSVLAECVAEPRRAGRDPRGVGQGLGPGGKRIDAGARRRSRSIACPRPSWRGRHRLDRPWRVFSRLCRFASRSPSDRPPGTTPA